MQILGLSLDPVVRSERQTFLPFFFVGDEASVVDLASAANTGADEEIIASVATTVIIDLRIASFPFL
jgi:hypothetical protein